MASDPLSMRRNGRLPTTVNGLNILNNHPPPLQLLLLLMLLFLDTGPTYVDFTVCQDTHEKVTTPLVRSA